MKNARPRWRPAARAAAASTTTLLLALTACSVTGGGEEETTTGSAADGSTVADRDVTLLVHDSWYMPKKVLRSFEEETGYRVEVQTNGDAGALTNKLVLTQDNPTMSYGVTTVEKIAEAVNRDLNPGPRARVPAAGVPPSQETPDETVPAGAG